MWLLSAGLCCEVVSVHVIDDEEDDVKPNVVTSKHVFLEVQVPKHAVGAVIGLQGSQIKQVSSLPFSISFRHHPSFTNRSLHTGI